MKVQPVVFTANNHSVTAPTSEHKPVQDTSYSRRQYKTLTLTGEFLAGSLLGYAMTNILSTKKALKKIDTLPKDEIIKTVNKSFKKNIGWGLLTGTVATIFANYYFDWTEPFNRKLIAKSEALDAQAKAKKELRKAIKSGDEELYAQAMDKLNSAVKSEVETDKD